MKNPIILHVDDDAQVREVTKELLVKAGMEVRAARNIVDAIQSALEKKPDLVLLDLHMPDGDGFEACVAFRALPELAAVPIVLLTSMEGAEHVERALASGATEHLVKPCPPAALIAAIKKRLSK